MNIALPKIKNPFSKNKEALSFGLDIGTQAVKIVKLKMVADVAELCEFYVEPVSIDLGPILQKVASSKVTLGSCGPSVIIRCITFPRMSHAEFRGALKFEAAKHIPFSITEVTLDGSILKDDIGENKMLVLLAAAKKDYINQRLKLTESANLRVGAIDVDALAIVNAFNFSYADDVTVKDKTTALLNIGSSFTNLSILENGIPRLSRDIQFGGNTFTKRIADAVGVDFKSAEEIKVDPEKSKAKNVSATLEPMLSSFASEVRTSFDYFETQSASSVEKIMLSGGGSLYGGLNDMLYSLLGIEVVSWDPLRRITFSASIDVEKVRASSAQLAVAVGLALRL